VAARLEARRSEGAGFFSRGRKVRCVGGEAMRTKEFYVPSLFFTSFFLVVEKIQVVLKNPIDFTICLF
jgi:hypothetical protein